MLTLRVLKAWETLVRWWHHVLIWVFAPGAESESYHEGFHKFLTEALKLCRRLTLLRMSQIVLGLFVLSVFVIGIMWCRWRLRVSRHNELWGLKKSVHSWTSFTTSAQPQYCSACRQLICGFWIFRNTGWECVVCGRTTHMRCLGACDNFDCKCPSQSDPLRHQLVQGNLTSDSVCCVCGIVCSSPFGLHGLRCLWCGCTVHEGCSWQLPDVCDLGFFQKLVLPPTVVRLSLTSAPSSIPPALSSLRSLLTATKKSMTFSQGRSKQASSAITNAKNREEAATGLQQKELSLAELSSNAQRYVRAVGVQLKEGLSQVQLAMITGFSGGFKEVSSDVQRLNELFYHEIRRRMRRALHHKHSKEKGSEPTPSQCKDSSSSQLLQTAPKLPNLKAASNGISSHHSAAPVSLTEEHRLSNLSVASSSSSSSYIKTLPFENWERCYCAECRSLKAESFRRHTSTSGGALTTHHYESPSYYSDSCVFGACNNAATWCRRNIPRIRLHSCVQEMPPINNPASDPKRLSSSNLSRSVASFFLPSRFHNPRCRPRRKRQKDVVDVARALAAAAHDKEDQRYSDRMHELARVVPAKADVWEIHFGLPVAETISERLHAASSHRTSCSKSEAGVHTGTQRSAACSSNTSEKGSQQDAKVPRALYSRYSSSFDMKGLQRSVRRQHLDVLVPSTGTTSASTSSFRKSERITSQLHVPPALKGRRPVLVFVNAKSGGQSGAQLLKEFYKRLNPMQVIDIQAEGGPQRALMLFKDLARINRLRVLVCGGDGSAGWVIDEIQKIYGPPSSCHVPVGILPLGTGNDLARVLGWGYDFDGDVSRFLAKFQSAQTRLLDLWNIKVTRHGVAGKSKEEKILETSFNNYVDIGVAARIALRFHQLREAHPELFQSRLGNKFLYGEMGVREWVTEKTVNLEHLRIWCDELPVVLPEKHIEGLIIVNIPSFSGGVDLWAYDEGEEMESFSDRSCNGAGCVYSMSRETQERSNVLRETSRSDKRNGNCSNVLRSRHSGAFDASDGQHCTREEIRKHRLRSESNEVYPLERRGRTLSRYSIRCASSCHVSPLLNKRRSRPPSVCFKKHIGFFPRRSSTPALSCVSGEDASSRYWNQPQSLYLCPPSCEGSSTTNSTPELAQRPQCPLTGETSPCVSVPGCLSRYSSTKHSFLCSRRFHRKQRSSLLLKETASQSPMSALPLKSSQTASFHSYKKMDTGLQFHRRWKKQSIRDELIEVVAVRSLFHLGQIQVGLAEPLRVCQGRYIKLEVPVDIPLQINGEPQMVPPCTIDISYKGECFVLSPIQSHNDVVMDTVAKVLDTAVLNSTLTSAQRDLLLHELNKRL